MTKMNQMLLWVMIFQLSTYIFANQRDYQLLQLVEALIDARAPSLLH